VKRDGTVGVAPDSALARIDPYRDADAAEVASLFAECAARDPTLVPISLAEWRAFTRESFNRGARDFRLARIGDRLVGVLTSTLLTGQTPPVRHFRIVVLPDLRRRGIGTLLLRCVEGQAPNPGLALQCNCSDHWTAGREFLRRHGFEVARRHLDMELRDPRAHPYSLPPGYSIRPHEGTASDDADWLRLNHAGYASDPDAQQPTAEDLAVRRAERGFRLWRLERDGSAVGFLHATSSLRARIHSLVVAPAHRGRGLGRGLMLHAVDALRQDGAVAVTLGVRVENDPAVRLYQQLRFEVIETTETWRRATPPRRTLPTGRIRALLCAALIPFAAAGSGCGAPPAGDAEAPEARPEPGSTEFDSRAFDSIPWAPGVLDRGTGTYRLAVPRQDLAVSVDGVRLAAHTTAEGWVAFKQVPGGAVLTAELPLLVDEVNPVISAALLHELRVTSLHQHLSREVPRLSYLHLTGVGQTDSLAAATAAVLQTLQDVRGQPREPPPAFDPTATAFDPAPVDSILGVRGRMRQGVYEITLPRSTRLEGFDLGAPSGIATRVTFAGAPERAVVSGSFALLESELQPVLRALRAAGLEITAVGGSLVGEEPRLVHVHYWGRGRAEMLARGIRDALDVTDRADG
jgi:mycothiol synthase